MISAADFLELVLLLGQQGRDDIEWAETLTPPATADAFALEAIFVIANSGMKNTVARLIYDRVVAAIKDGKSASTAFGHKGKCGGIDAIWARRHEIFAQYITLSDDFARLDFLATLPWIGEITKYHAAKNFGLDHLCKPDVHLQRLANHEGVTPQALCERLQADLAAAGTHYKISTIDTILWRACANGVMSSNTGLIVREAA